MKQRKHIEAWATFGDDYAKHGPNKDPYGPSNFFLWKSRENAEAEAGYFANGRVVHLVEADDLLADRLYTRAEVLDLKARLRQVRYLTKYGREVGVQWDCLNAATDLRRKNWREP